MFKTKSGKAHEIPINNTLWEYLKTQSRDNPNDYVLKASHGNRFRSIKDQFKNALKKVGLEPARVHDLRDSWAMRLLEKDVDPYTVIRLGGWSSFKTFKRYLRRYQRNLTLAVQNLDSVTPYCH